MDKKLDVFACSNSTSIEQLRLPEALEVSIHPHSVNATTFMLLLTIFEVNGSLTCKLYAFAYQNFSFTRKKQPDIFR